MGVAMQRDVLRPVVREEHIKRPGGEGSGGEDEQREGGKRGGGEGVNGARGLRGTKVVGEKRRGRMVRRRGSVGQGEEE